MTPLDCPTPGFPVHHQLPGFLKLMSIESVMPSNHLIPCRPLLLLPSIFPSKKVFSNESVLHIKWPKYWSFSFSFSISPWMLESQNVSAVCHFVTVSSQHQISSVWNDVKNPSQTVWHPPSRKMQETSGVKKRESQETKEAVASLPLHVLTPLQARPSLTPSKMASTLSSIVS